VDDDHYHTVVNPAKGEKPGERGLPDRGYRLGRKSAKRRQGKKHRRNRESGPRQSPIFD
jgi:hypothetical protein